MGRGEEEVVERRQKFFDERETTSIPARSPYVPAHPSIDYVGRRCSRLDKEWNWNSYGTVEHHPCLEQNVINWTQNIKEAHTVMWN